MFLGYLPVTTHTSDDLSIQGRPPSQQHRPFSDTMNSPTVITNSCSGDTAPTNWLWSATAAVQGLGRGLAVPGRCAPTCKLLLAPSIRYYSILGHSWQTLRMAPVVVISTGRSHMLFLPPTALAIRRQGSPLLYTSGEANALVSPMKWLNST